MSLERLVTVLARERQLLEALVHRVTVTSLVMVADEERFLGQAADEVAELSEELNAVETLRAMVTADVADELGLDADEVTLERIIRAVPPAEQPVLQLERDQLRALVHELEEAVPRSTTIASAGLGEVRAALERLAVGRRDLLYGRAGGSTPPEVPPTWFDDRA